MTTKAKKQEKVAGKSVHFDHDLAKFTDRQQVALSYLDSGMVKYLLYGGALGGGKSFFLRWYGVRRLIWLYQAGFPNAMGMLACEDYPSLKDRQLQKIAKEIPPWMGKMHGDHRDYGRCFILAPSWGGGVLAFRNLDDPSKYASAEFAFILVDELTKNPYDVFTFLRTRLRWPGLADIQTQFVGATNPGSIGHGWVKQLWMDKQFPDEWVKPVDYRGQFAYVPSKADDNPHLDAAYWATLSTLPENLRKAFRDGDWNIFIGQAFPDFGSRHVIDPIKIPQHAPLYMTFDWGFGAPFSVLWFWVDADNRLYLFDEWYGWNGAANQGLRIPDSEIADGIAKREASWGIDPNRHIHRISGPDCFQKKPDYRGGGQGPSTAEVFAERKIFLTPGHPDRALKIRAFRERIAVPKDDTMPMLVVYRHCEQFMRTIQNLTMDENHIEDVDTKGEDHQYDSVALMCMARPMSMQMPKDKLTSHDKHIESIHKPITDGFELEAMMEQSNIMRQLDGGAEYGDVGEYEDGDENYQSDLRGTV